MAPKMKDRLISAMLSLAIAVCASLLMFKLEVSRADASETGAKFDSKLDVTEFEGFKGDNEKDLDAIRLEQKEIKNSYEESLDKVKTELMNYYRDRNEDLKDLIRSIKESD